MNQGSIYNKVKEKINEYPKEDTLFKPHIETIKFVCFYTVFSIIALIEDLDKQLLSYENILYISITAILSYILILNKIKGYKGALDEIKAKNKTLEQSYNQSQLLKKELKEQYFRLKEQHNKEVKFQEKLQSLAYYDQLTGLPNKSLLEEELKKIRDIKAGLDYTMTLIYLNIDNFKYVNESLGHAWGDRLLRQIGLELKKFVKSPHYLAKMNGDSFIIVLNEYYEHSAIEEYINQLLKRIRRLWKVDSYEFFITFSIGIAIYPEHGIDFNTLLQKADMAMFEAKAQGKDRYYFYTEQIKEKILKHVTTTYELRQAFESEAFEIYYQPQYDLITGKEWGVKASIRLKYPIKGINTQDSLISLVEEIGLSENLDHWVIKEVCRQKHILDQSHFEPLKIAVQLSDKSIKNSLIEVIESSVKMYHVDPKDIMLIMTETAVFSRLNQITGMLSQLSKQGFVLALDGFRAGLSMAYLRDLSFDILKIDKGFIDWLITEEEHASMIKSVINLAHNLKLKVLVENIENEAQMTLLKSCQCDLGQGDLFGEPLSFEALL